MIALQQDTKQGEPIVGVVEDRLGNKIGMHAYYGRSELLMAISDAGTPMGSIMVRDEDGLTLTWEDNIVRGLGLLGQLGKLADSNSIPCNFVVGELSLKSFYTKADILCIMGNNKVITCIAITLEGDIILWKDADYRKSKEMKDYNSIVYGLALKNKLIAKDLNDFNFGVATSNAVSNRYVAKWGCSLKGGGNWDGIATNVYTATKKSHIEKARVIASKYGINF